MAQIIISTLDSENGSVNIVTKFEDKDLQRIYNAYRHNYAAAVIKRKSDAGEILEAYETVESLSKNVDPQTVLTELVHRLIKDMLYTTYNTERNITLENNPIDEIVWNI